MKLDGVLGGYCRDDGKNRKWSRGNDLDFRKKWVTPILEILQQNLFYKFFLIKDIEMLYRQENYDLK
jgi:hypothetical protein